MSENSLIAAASATNSFAAPAEVTSSDLAAGSTDVLQRRPEEKSTEDASENSGPKNLADELTAIDNDVREQREARKRKEAEVEAAELEDIRQSLEAEDPDAEEDEGESDEEGEEGDESEEAEAESEEQEPEAAKPEPFPDNLADLSPEQHKQLEQRISEVSQRSSQVNHPVMTQLFAEALAEPLGVSPQDLPKLQQAIQVMQVGAQSLIETALPSLITEYMVQNFGPLLESYAPGLGDAFREAQVANTWHAVLESDEFKDLGLPRHNTPEFAAAAEKVYRENPWLSDFDPVGKDGRQLPVLEALKVKATVVARLLAGERVSPKAVLQQVAQAVDQGRKSAERATRRVSAAKALKGGKPTGAINEREEYLSLLDAYKNHHSGSFSK